MIKTPIRVDAIPAIDRREAGRLAAAENQRFVDLVRSLEPANWSASTDCPLWDVRAMVGHLLGSMEGNASFRQFVHQFRAGKKAAGDGPDIDGMTAVQVTERAGLTTDEVVAQLVAIAPKAAKARLRIPWPMRAAPIKTEVAGKPETWKLGFLMDIIFTRDTWMHRIDISRAIGRGPVLTDDHDGRLIADVVADWSRRHGQPFTLELTGPAGGTYTSGDGRTDTAARPVASGGTDPSGGDGGEVITVDAVEFCRTLSGRAHGAGLLSTEVPF